MAHVIRGLHGSLTFLLFGLNRFEYVTMEEACLSRSCYGNKTTQPSY